MNELLPKKTFKFRGKKYRWTCTKWQALLFVLFTVAGAYSSVLLLSLFGVSH